MKGVITFTSERVNLLTENQAKYLAVPMKKLVKQFEFKMLYGRLKGKYLAKKRVKELRLKKDNQVELTYSHKYTCQYIDRIEPNKIYDLAISFLTPHYICMNKVNAKKRLRGYILIIQPLIWIW